MSIWRIIRNYPRLDADMNIHYDHFEEVFHSHSHLLAKLVYEYHALFHGQPIYRARLTSNEKPLEEIAQQLRGEIHAR